MSRIIFITGTDTGVGKTVLTCLLLQYLRGSGVPALAMKPFCSGGREDLEAIRRIQGDELESAILNPYYFKHPLAPAVAAEKIDQPIQVSKAAEAIKKAAKRCDCLLVEGAGGLMVPLSRRRTMLDLIVEVGAEVIVVSQNKLGAINHAVLTLQALQKRVGNRAKLIFFSARNPDLSSSENARWVKQMAGNVDVFELPWLGESPARNTRNFTATNNFKKTLAQICNPDNVCPVVRTAETKQRNERLKNEK